MVEQAHTDRLAGRRETYEIEYRIVRSDCQIRWIHDHGAKIFNERGELYRVSGIARDITERKLTEQAIRESEQRYRVLAENSSDLIGRYTPDSMCLYMSPASRTLLGYEPEEMVGRLGCEVTWPTS